MSLKFTNSFVNQFPLYQPIEIKSERTPNVLGARVDCERVKAPKLLGFSSKALSLLGLSEDEFQNLQPAEVFSGNLQLPGMQPFASRYGGHQFGHWAGQLGDGRAIILGEVLGSKQQKWEIQLKGAGRTPYSRSGDGKAVLRSSLREYICSEAMQALGIPTTRALCLVTTGESVIRDMFYDGNPQREAGAIVTRLAPSFLRFGQFQILSVENEIDLLQELVQFCISEYYPELLSLSDERAQVAGFFKAVMKLTIEMVVGWMRVGFVHGVMNTDNMSILGLTIDYGPYGWLDNFDPTWTPNTTDLPRRRYCFQNQPGIALWNLERLAEALLPLTNPQDLQICLQEYQNLFLKEYWAMRFNKLGVGSGSLKGVKETEAIDAINLLDELMYELQIDHTLFYAELQEILNTSNEDRLIKLKSLSYLAEFQDSAFLKLADWFDQFYKDLNFNNELAGANNPALIPRNFLTLEVIAAVEKGDLQALDNYLKALESPYSPEARKSVYYKKRPEAALALPGASQLSCSS